MDADERYTGRGVTIAFLDSGFFAHKDLTEPVNRIAGYHNIFAPEDDRSALEKSDVASWHGMMTSVVAAGNGHLSEGFYRSIAPEAKVVLVKIGKTEYPVTVVETAMGHAVIDGQRSTELVSDWKIGDPLYRGRIDQDRGRRQR